ncbi:MAG: HipA N-terminal domain-containing protein [Bacilli bacterium]|jgi:serine/threonine-protein kinase HipA|nr:HipA N-terminal domain-containing protein [Bacilli bacterium]
MIRQGFVYFQGTFCGVLSETDTGYEFAYDSTWLDNPQAQPISLTMPLQKEPYFSHNFFSFFDGLIPEGWLLEVVVHNWKVSSQDRMGLALVSLTDPIGAVQVFRTKEAVSHGK